MMKYTTTTTNRAKISAIILLLLIQYQLPPRKRSEYIPTKRNSQDHYIQGDPAFKNCILRKGDTENFENVSIYKKVLSLNEFHFLIHSLILV